MEKPVILGLRAAPFDELIKQICTYNIDPTQTLELLQLLPRYAPRQHLFRCIVGLTNHYSTVGGGLKLLLQWCSNFFHRDFGDNLRSKLFTFVTHISSILPRNTLDSGVNMPESSVFLNACTSILNKIKLCIIREVCPKVPLPSANIVMKPSTKSITCHAAKEVAEQLTKLEHLLFSQIPIQDFVLYPKETSPRLKAFIDRFDNIVSWVLTHVTRRANNPIPVLKYFVKVAHYCEILGNYNSTYELFASFSAHSLKGILKDHPLPSKYKHRIDKLEEKFSVLGNFRVYRSIIRHHQELAERKKRPFLPYLGLFLKDLTVINEANPDLISGNINVDKICLLGGIFRTIRVCQSLSYESAIPSVDRGLYDSLLSLDIAPAKKGLSVSFLNNKLVDSLIQVNSNEIPVVCSSGTFSTSDGPATMTTFIDFLTTGTRATF